MMTVLKTNENSSRLALITKRSITIYHGNFSRSKISFESSVQLKHVNRKKTSLPRERGYDLIHGMIVTIKYPFVLFTQQNHRECPADEDILHARTVHIPRIQGNHQF